jgi:hypothetical protein
MLDIERSTASAPNREQANQPKSREAAKPARRQPQAIHPSLRALPDYPE